MIVFIVIYAKIMSSEIHVWTSFLSVVKMP